MISAVFCVASEGTVDDLRHPTIHAFVINKLI